MCAVATVLSSFLGFTNFFFSCFCQAHEAHRFSLCAHSRAPLHRKYRWNAVSKFKLASPGRPERKVGRIQTPAWAKSGTKLTLDPPSNPYCPAPALVSQHGCFSNTCFGASLTYPTLPPWQRKMSALNLVGAVADVLSSFPGLTNFSSLASASSTRPHKFNLRARSGSLDSNCKAYWRWRRNVTHKDVQAYTHATTDRRRS